MKTDLANLGLSLRGTTDRISLKAPQSILAGMNKGEANRQQPAEASSFDQVFKQKSEPKVETTYANGKPVPIEKDVDRGIPDKGENPNVQSGTTRDEPRMVSKEKNNWDDSGSVSKSRENSGESEDANEVSTKEGSQTQNKELSKQQQAMLKFMDSMENEFGIPPTRIVEAMAQLPADAQESPPIETAPQVIDKLNLPEEQQDRALAMYVAMLSQMKAPPQVKAPEAFMVTPGANQAMVQPNPAAAAGQKKAMLNESLDKLNQSFFVNNRELAAASGNDAAATTTVKNAKTQPVDLMRPQNNEWGNDQLKLEQLKADQMTTNQIYGAGKANNTATAQALQQMKEVNPNAPESQEFLKSLAALGAAAAALNQQMKEEPGQQAGQQAAAVDSQGNTLGGQQNNPLSALGNQQSSVQSLAGRFSEGSMGDGGDSADNKDFFATDRSVDANAAKPAHHLGADNRAEFKDVMNTQNVSPQAAGVTPGEHKANIQQIMNQAQYMIRKGGGETNVQMSPEGLGKVHMRIIVNEGKVSLEMSAESKETKKILENSIGDLRTSLGQHKMSIEHVKVDVGNQSSDSKYSDSQNSQNRQQDLSKDMGQQDGRDQARQFWNQYRDGEQRNQFIPNPGLRGYGETRRQLAPLQPGASSAVSERRYVGSGKGLGVDLVA